MKAAFNFEQTEHEEFLLENTQTQRHDDDNQKPAVHCHTPLSEEEEARQQRLALNKICAIYDQCMDEGIEPDSVAHAGIFQSLVVMVEIYGEEPVANLMGQIIEGIRLGRYTTNGPTH
jgi:hypothetical protein